MPLCARTAAEMCPVPSEEDSRPVGCRRRRRHAKDNVIAIAVAESRLAALVAAGSLAGGAAAAP
eukprot:SAG22_NODE_7268_length_756_cov_1.182648_1_plen_63_part_10